MKAPRRPRLAVAYFSAHSRRPELSPGKITAVSAADQNIANNNDHAWPQIMNDSMGGILFRHRETFPLSSVRRSEQRAFALVESKSVFPHFPIWCGMVALGNGGTVTAWFTKVRLPSVVPAEVWSSPYAALPPLPLSLSLSCGARHFRGARFFSGSSSTDERGKSRSFFDGNNSGRRPRRPRMRLIDGRELARSSESRGYLSIDPRPRGASAAFRVIRGRWEQIRVLAFPRFRARLATVQTAEVRYARWEEGREKGDSFSLM